MWKPNAATARANADSTPSVDLHTTERGMPPRTASSTVAFAHGSSQWIAAEPSAATTTTKIIA